MMQQRLWLAFAAVAGMSFAIQLSLPLDLNDRPETTFDSAPRGHAGLFALLDRFEATPGRWLSGVVLPPVSETIWWIAPAGACDARASTPSDEDSANAERELPSAFEITVRPWIESGGTAVVWLSHPPLEADGEDAWRDVEREQSEAAEAHAGRREWEEKAARSRELIRSGIERRCEAILGLKIPARRLAGLEGGRPPEVGRNSPVVFSVGRATSRREDFDYKKTRILPGPTLAFFELEDVGDDLSRDWKPLWVEADERTPLALERSVGEGRLILISDARIVSNGRLAHVDSAPFVFDWVREAGRPWIDEHAHGVVPESGTLRYLARSPAWAAGVGLLLMGALVIWRGHAWPTREVSEFDPNSPTLASFVDSVARLYSRTQDHTQVFDRYRRLCLDRIRRALGLAPGTSAEIVLTSLQNRAGNWPELEQTGLRHLLIQSVSIPTAADLARNVSRLDDLVRVLRESGKRQGVKLE
jgi:hypothetical protein